MDEKTTYAIVVVLAAAVLILGAVALTSKPAQPVVLPPPSCGLNPFCQLGNLIGGVQSWFDGFIGGLGRSGTSVVSLPGDIIAGIGKFFSSIGDNLLYLGIASVVLLLGGLLLAARQNH
ncbi:MAG: hypothetical protein WC759_05715 [Candidatus Micrarchaeia archaeon]|jgi:hypothetical protein